MRSFFMLGLRSRHAACGILELDTALVAGPAPLRAAAGDDATHTEMGMLVGGHVRCDCGTCEIHMGR